MIVTGALLLYVFCNVEGMGLTLLDAFYTATSATCVTGLIVVDTSLLPPTAQVTLLILIQLGGLGVMTMTTAVFLLAGRHVNHYQRLLFTSSMGLDHQAGAIRILKRILVTTFCIEILGVFFLWLGFMKHMSILQALWYAVFHSISAFCNAGFSLFSDNLIPIRENPLIWGTILMLIVSGGLGFMVIYDLYLRFCGQRQRLSLHSRLVLITTAVLIVAGALLVLAGQWSHQKTIWDNLANLKDALFLSISARTAGFNIMPMEQLGGLSMLVLSILMIIGASPGSTGGGVKTTTFAVLVSAAWRGARGIPSVVVARRTVPYETITRSLTVAMLYLTSLFVGLLIMEIFEAQPLHVMLFEVISAMGTVGLSLTRSGSFGSGGKIVAILFMFWGRVGILTFAYGMLKKQRHCDIGVSYPDASIPIG